MPNLEVSFIAWALSVAAVVNIMVLVFFPDKLVIIGTMMAAFIMGFATHAMLRIDASGHDSSQQVERQHKRAAILKDVYGNCIELDATLGDRALRIRTVPCP